MVIKEGEDGLLAEHIWLNAPWIRPSSDGSAAWIGLLKIHKSLSDSISVTMHPLCWLLPPCPFAEISPKTHNEHLATE